MEWCTACSRNVSELNELTGWCARCTTLHYLEQGLLICASCGRFFSKDPQFRLLCRTCRDLDWEHRNADAIERWMGAGLPYMLAKKRVTEHNRPICINCGDRIRNGTGGRHFLCGKQPCRQVYRRYKLYWYDHGVPKDVAIEKALQVAQQERNAVAILNAIKNSNEKAA